MVKETIKQMDCDILGLQEVNYEENLELFDLDTYNLHLVSLPSPMLKSEPEFRIDGNAILLKKSWEVLSELKLVYSSQNRVAQALQVKKDDFEFFHQASNEKLLTTEWMLGTPEEEIEDDIDEAAAARYAIPEKVNTDWTQIRSHDGTPIRP